MKSTNQTVLIFCDWYRPGYKAGGPITSSVNLIENLGDQIQFKLVCGDRDYLSDQPYENTEFDTWVKVGKGEVMYLSPQNQTYQSLKSIVEHENPKMVYINGIFSKNFSINPLRAATALNLRTIVAPRGMLAEGALGVKPLKKKLFLSIAKLLKLYRDVCFHVTFESEAGRVHEILGANAQTVLIPNLPSNFEKQNRTKPKEQGQIRIVSLARIAKEKNTLFALEVLKEIPPGVKVCMDFYGEVYDQEYFQKCKSFAATLPSHIAVNFCGVITPDEVSEVFRDADLFFMPTLGENYGHAIIESLLTGTPVLISDQTPWVGLASDGLGADLPLSERQLFFDFIIDLGNMDNSNYEKQFSEVAETVSKRIKLSEIRDAYIRLLS